MDKEPPSSFQLESNLPSEFSILTKLEARGRTPEKRGKKSGATLAGWTYEYIINPVTAWSTPWELAEKRSNLKQQKNNKKQLN